MSTTKRKPSHPGEILKRQYIEPLEITITDAAQAIGVTRQALSNLTNCHTDISIEMSLRLAKAFDTTPEFWLNLQKNYDLWHAQEDKSIQEMLKQITILYHQKERTNTLDND